jgi:hypothetical protein
VAVGEQLRGFVDDGHHLLDLERLLLGDRGDHGACGGRADRSGELELREAHEVAVALKVVDALDPAVPRVGREELGGTRRAEEPAHEGLQRRGRGRPAPARTGLARLAEDIHEEGRLGMLARALAAEHRDEHAPR